MVFWITLSSSSANVSSLGRINRLHLQERRASQARNQQKQEESRLRWLRFPPASAGFLLGLFFASEHRSNIHLFIGNVWFSPNYTASQTRRPYSPQPPPWGPQIIHTVRTVCDSTEIRLRNLFLISWRFTDESLIFTPNNFRSIIDNIVKSNAWKIKSGWNSDWIVRLTSQVARLWTKLMTRFYFCFDSRQHWWTASFSAEFNCFDQYSVCWSIF
jgi:hypothetical protein